ncbi:MAG TPA: hypothetical protein VNO70_27045, partial [Blastocatellia bacterium]|nr:hypothetical protein [Blastocatellia bacterium]
ARDYTGKTLTSEVGSATRATSSPYSIEVWNIQTGQRVTQINGATGDPPQAMTGGALSPDGKLLATENGEEFLLWDADTGQLLVSQVHQKNYAVRALAFSGDGRFLVSGSLGEVVKVWRVGDLLEGASAK